MADVTGPISTLPGTGHHLPEGADCDLHPGRPAVVRLQGETDSFGSEMNDMCQECLDKHREYIRNRDTSGVCDWCKQHKPRLGTARDYDEGMYGPVYDVCADCLKRRDERIQEELKRYECIGLDDYDDYS